MSDVGASGGEDPVLLHHPTRRSVGYFGAVGSARRKLDFSERGEESFNAVTFHTFLNTLRQISSRSGRRIVVIYRQCQIPFMPNSIADWRSQQAPQFILDFLPPLQP